MVYKAFLLIKANIIYCKKYYDSMEEPTAIGTKYGHVQVGIRKELYDELWNLKKIFSEELQCRLSFSDIIEFLLKYYKNKKKME